MHEFFLGIEGQKSAIDILTELHSKNRIPHALLFTGLDGVGKFNVALQFLKLVNNSISPELAHKINSLQEPYVKLIIPLPRGKSETNSDLPMDKLTQDTIDEITHEIELKQNNPYHKINIKNANNIKINSIREINKVISLNFDEIPYRGIFILDSHKMSIEAQNAFLKNLEEPPEGIIYFLFSDRPEQLLDTIKSRCWNIHFNPLQEKHLNNILHEYYEFSNEEIENAIPFAQGSVTNAVYLINNDLENFLHKTILILRYSLARKYHTALKEFTDVIDEKSVVAYNLIIDLIILWLNDTIKDKMNINNIYFSKFNETIKKFNLRFQDVNINQVITKLVELKNAPQKNVSLNLLVLNVIFELASIGMNKK